MDAARWQRAKQLIADALARPPAERAAFLSSACPDEDLRREIEVMLTSSEDETAEDIRLPVVERDESASTSVADSSEAPAAFEFTPGHAAGPYVFTAPLGKGGGGEVYRARDSRLQRDVAIKVLRAKDAAEGARRVREARAAAQLNHRSIAAIYDVFDMAGRTYIVQEYVAGDTLADRMRHRTFPAADIFQLGTAIADAVAHAHAAGIVHCDLKPGNIRFASDGGIKILDFGLARRAPERASRAADVTGLSASSLQELGIGTPGYMSPEQLLGSSVDCRSDVYSLGVILFEMAAGQRPFSATDMMSTAVAVLTSPLPDLPRSVPRRLRAIIARCLERTPEDRYASAAELRAALVAAQVSRWKLVVGSVLFRK
jgi:serine/threonine protein kinase